MMRHISFLNLQLVNSRMHDEMLAAMDRVLQSGWYLNGRELANFERRFSEYVGTEYAVGVANGFDALTLILMAMKDMQQWEDGDEVIVPALTFIATAEAVSRAGLTPVFADVDDNFVMTATTAKQVVSARTKALMPVHLYGRMAPMGELTALAREMVGRWLKMPPRHMVPPTDATAPAVRPTPQASVSIPAKTSVPSATVAL